MLDGMVSCVGFNFVHDFLMLFISVPDLLFPVHIASSIQRGYNPNCLFRSVAGRVKNLIALGGIPLLRHLLRRSDDLPSRLRAQSIDFDTIMAYQRHENNDVTCLKCLICSTELISETEFAGSRVFDLTNSSHQGFSRNPSRAVKFIPIPAIAEQTRQGHTVASLSIMTSMSYWQQ